MHYEWDENKNQINIEKHGFDFNDTHLLFEQPYLIYEDSRANYGEKRFIAVGTIKDRVVVLIFTKRNNKIRIISMRTANERETKKFKDRLETY